MVAAGIVFVSGLAAGALFWHLRGTGVGSSPDWVDVEQLNGEYRAATERLALPAGEHWPAELPFKPVAPDGAANLYASGIGAEWAEWYWFDVWAGEAVSASKPVAVRRAAIASLSEFSDMGAFAAMTAEGQVALSEMIASAQKGDCTALEEYVSASTAARRGRE